MDELDEGRRKLRTLAIAAKVGIALVLAAGASDLLFVLAPASAPNIGYLAFGDASAVWASDLAVLLSATPVAMWIYRAHANLEAAELPGLEYTPGWSVGWFFIPVASLWKPFSAMRELWNASHGAVGDYSETPPALLFVWWLGWLLRSFAGFEAISVPLEIIGMAALIASAGSLWIIISTVTRRQESFGLGQVFA